LSAGADLVRLRLGIEAQHLNPSSRRFQQAEQQVDDRGFAGAVGAK
jgi:hypothetical protein